LIPRLSKLELLVWKCEVQIKPRYLKEKRAATAALFLDGCSESSREDYDPLDHEHPVVDPHVSHFMQVPFRTRVKFPHSEHISPS